MPFIICIGLPREPEIHRIVANIIFNTIFGGHFEKNEEDEEKESLTADHLLLSEEYAEKALKLFESYKKDSNDKEKVSEIMECIVESLRYGFNMFYSGNNGSMEEQKEFIVKILDKMDKINKKSELDKNTRIVYNYFLYFTSSPEVAQFNNECLKKYPGETLFYQTKMNLYLVSEEIEEGVKFALTAFKKFPDDPEILFLAADLYHNLLVKEIKAGELEKDYDDFSTKINRLKGMFKKFLAAAPKDHRNYPQAFYTMAYHHQQLLEDQMASIGNTLAQLFHQENNEIIKQFKKYQKYYNKAIEAEKDQLSCFLPYKSKEGKIVFEYMKEIKDLPLFSPLISLETIDTSIKRDKSGKTFTELNLSRLRSESEGLFSTENKIVRPTIEEQLTKDTRVKIIKKHRLAIKNSHFHGQELKNEPELGQNGPKHNLAKMKSRLLKNTYFKKEKVYKNSYIDFIIVEDPLILDNNSVSVIAHDKEWEAQRIVINNFKKNVQDFLGFGCKLTIVEPHFKLDQDKSPIIQVDDQNNMVFSTEKIMDRCRFCGKSNSTLACTKCKRKYCSKECQTNDWKIMKHKLICK